MPDSRNLMLQLIGQQGIITGQSFSMETAEVTLGRAPDNTISIPDAKISRYHTRLRQTAQGWLVEDLNSANGTFINEQRLTAPAWLQPGDTLRLGDSVVFNTQVAPEAESTIVSRHYAGPPPPPPPPPFSGPPPPAAQGRRFPWLLIPLGGLLLLLLLIAGIAIYLMLAPKPITRPTVLLQPPPSGNEVAIGEPAQLFGQARDSKLVTRAELWADGKLANVIGAGIPGGSNPLIFSPSWTPDTAGSHALFARAYTADGRMGQSSVLYLSAKEIAKGPVLLEQPITTTMTITDLAQSTGSTVDMLVQLNPGLPTEGPLPTDESVIVPEVTGEATAEETATPTATPTPEGGGVGPAEATGGLTTPSGLSATDIGCKIHLIWNDAENESGYRIFSRPPGGLVYTQIAELEANTTSYDFDVTTPGSWGVYIIAFTSEAELASSPAEVVIAAGPTCPAGPGTDLAFNATAMEAPNQYDHVYCFASLANSPYERVPTDDGIFVNRGVADALNITEHLAGAQARQFNWPGATPLPVKFECWGWAGADLDLLGTFTNNHPAEEWDGRPLTGSGDNFVLHYTINRVPSGGPPALDPTMPVPENVHLNPSWIQCLGSVYRGDPYPNIAACINNMSIAWQWPSPYDTGLIQGWRIYERRWSNIDPGSATEHVFNQVPLPPRRGDFIPPFPSGCGESVEYRVSAFSYGRESAKSFTDVTAVNAPCPTYPMVTWETLTSHDLHDHFLDDNLESYGYLGMQGVWKYWNAATGPYSFISPHTTYNWADMTIEGSHHHNVMVAPIGEMENLNLSVALWDDDIASPDESWCIGGIDLPGRTYAQWQATNETHTINGNGPKGSCSVSVRINGVTLPPAAVVIPRDLRATVLAPFGGTGTPQFELRNMGPEFMLNETATILQSYERSRTVGPSTETESHSFPPHTVHLTMPASTALTFPADFVVEDGWTTIVQLTVIPGSFPDPNMANNTHYRTFNLE
jgi:hypothetical protein